MAVIKNIGLLATCKAKGAQSDIHPIKKAAVAFEGQRIAWVGQELKLPKKYQKEGSFDAGGCLVVPGLIDCHTHLAFAEFRDKEFEKKILGESYLDIAQAGGGILSTVNSTRKASAQKLIEHCLKYTAEMVELGITTIECKSGYGLSLNDELKILSVYSELNKAEQLDIVSTFMGAHTVPTEYKNNRSEYIKLICEEMLPMISEHGLASFCDVFVEDSAFTANEAKTIFKTSKKFGLLAKLHADQLTPSGGAELAASVGAVSADHLEYISKKGIEQMARKAVVAVMLPLASLYTHQPACNARKLIDGGVDVAVATDFNPGSAPSYHLPLAMMLSCNMNRMTPAEVLKGATINAAKALGLEKDRGSIEAGKLADFAFIDASDVNDWMYHFVPNACLATIKRGELIYSAE